MSEIKHANIKALEASHKCEHENYEYERRKFVPFGGAKHTLVSVYEVPPMKSPYPYHYHHKNEETFYIISGEGILKTPTGERNVTAGDFLFFPTGPEGAHKLTNCSKTEKLVYIDFDVVHDIDIAESLIKELMQYGLRGIEAYHRKHTPACVEYFSSMAGT